MSMKFAGRDFKKNPLTRQDTQIFPDPTEPVLVQQNLNDGGRLDTTKIVAKFFENGVITHTRDATARYIDATAITDFREAMTVKARADQAFAELPDEIRKKQFDNDPRAFVEFCSNPDNLETLREWGLAKPLTTPEHLLPVKVEIINPEPPKGSSDPA